MNLIKCPNCDMENPESAQFCAECGVRLEPAKKTAVSQTEPGHTPREVLAIGSTFGQRFEVIEELGQGSLGKVYKVLDKPLGREVVLKLIKPEIAQDKKTLERFSNELKTAKKIVHKNVGRMFDLSEEKGTHYITMEYMTGQDLKGLIRQTRRLTIEKAVSIAGQVCTGLAEAHRLGAVHLDLRPGNIMVDKKGNAKILDFGIARPLYPKAITDAGVMIPTPEYTSPEQVEGKDVDQRSDIYSLGIILYEMVTGGVPFEGDNTLAISEKQKHEMPNDPRELNHNISEDFSRLILKCLEKDKEKRYQNVEELRSDLENIGKIGKPIQPIEPKERPIPPKKPLPQKEIKAKSPGKIKLAQTLDPFSPMINANVGALLYFSRQYNLALEELKKALRADPSYHANHYFLGMVYIQIGQYEEALKSFRQAAEFGGGPLEMSLRAAYVYALLGQRNEVGKILTAALKASSPTYVPQVTIGTVYASLGEKDQAFACLEKALSERDAWLVYLKVYPMFDSVQRDPHFISILRKIGLEK